MESTNQSNKENIRNNFCKLVEENEFSLEEIHDAFHFHIKEPKDSPHVLSDELMVSSISFFNVFSIFPHSNNKMVLEEKYSIKRSWYSFEWKVQVSWDNDTDIKIVILPYLISKPYLDFVYDCRISKVSSRFTSSGMNYQLTMIKDFDGQFIRGHYEKSTHKEHMDSIKLGVIIDLVAIVDPLTKNTFSPCFRFLSGSTNSRNIYNLRQKVNKSQMEVDISKPELDVNQIQSKSEQPRKSLIEQLHYDTKLVVQGQVLYAHKCILAAFSSIFHEQISINKVELPYPVIEIDEFHYETVDRMLRFIYTNQIVTSDKNYIIDLLKIASKYAINTLREKCEQILLEYINIDTCIDFIILGIKYDALQLKNRAVAIFVEYQLYENFDHWISSSFLNDIKKLISHIVMDLSVNNMKAL